jgi:hypothetical protein
MEERIRALIKKALAADNDAEGARITEELKNALHEYLEQTRKIVWMSFSPDAARKKNKPPPDKQAA